MYFPPDYSLECYGLTPEMLRFVNTFKVMEQWKLRKTIKSSNDSNKNNFIYKYTDLKLENDFSIEKIESLLIKSKLYLSVPTGFNDPYEFMARYQFHADAKIRKKHFESMAKRALMRGHDEFPKIRSKRRKIEAMVTLLTKRNIVSPGIVDQAMDKSSESFGVCCFSKTPRSILMWSYYSCGHEGFCLQFNPFLDPGVLLLAQDVKYNEVLPNVVFPDDEDKLDAKVNLSKSDAWRHEEEVRYVSHKVRNSTIEFDGRALTGIIFGIRCSEQVIDKVKEILERRVMNGLPMPRLYRATQLRNNYGVKVVREPD